jgi:hypothetical protein
VVFVVSPSAGKISAPAVGNLQYELARRQLDGGTTAAIKPGLQIARAGYADKLFDLSPIIKLVKI